MALTEKLTAVADAIRSKTGKTDVMTLDQMPTEIESISGGGIEPFDLTITSFMRDSYATVVYEKLGQYVNPVVTVTGKSFGKVPDNFKELLPNVTDIVCTSNSVNLESTFADTKMKSTSEVPKITANKVVSIKWLFHNSEIEKIEADFFDNITTSSWHSSGGYCTNVFDKCTKLKEIPEKVMKVLYDTGTVWNKSFIYTSFSDCYSLRAINKLQVPTVTVTNGICPTIDSVNLGSFTFDTDDGVKTWNAKSQTLDLSKCGIGTTSYEERYGISFVYNETSYQQYKNELDWCGTIDYSKYNKTSAVETINSLPDTSAYLAANGGTNTIKFKGAAGALTDGGAINTMTAEEIAVAAAKGWTVTFV